MENVEGTPSAVSQKTYRVKRLVAPIAIGVVLSATILGILNYPWLMAQWHYRFGHHHKTVAVLGARTTKSTPPVLKPDPSAPAKISIPAIDVEAPIILDEPSTVDWKVQLALRRGVVLYGNSAKPDQTSGNVVIVGHSSGQAWAPGDYKWIFTLLGKLQPGDQIEVNYQGIPYIYEVTGSTIVKPTDATVLTQTAEPTLTLVTCTPVGTSTNRLIVHAKRVSPLQ